MSTYAAFVMTYRRPAILKETVMALLAQSVAPSCILIVDNDPEHSAKSIAEHFRHKNVRYHSVGFNSGPAGAAYWGCKLLFEEGWEWVLWVDDDDPPVLPTLIEEFFKLYSSYPEPQKIGIIGAVGVRFDSNKAKTVRIKQEDLQGIQEVDNIAGNQFPLIHRRVFERGIFPDPKLFFGFEELEFNLRVKENGFRIVIEAEILRELRAYWQTQQKQNKLYVPKNKSRLWREYFSTRNMVYILKCISNNRSGLILFALRSLLKSMIGFRYGIGYGLANASSILKGLHHGFSGRLGPL